MQARLRTLPALAATLLLAAPIHAGARPPALPDVPAPLYLAQAANSEREAAAQARQRYGGKVLRVKTGERAYEVRLLMPDGRVRHVDVPRAGDRAGRG